MKRVYSVQVGVKIKLWAQVHYLMDLMESVFSMDETDRAVVSQHMKSEPYLVDAF